MKKLFLLSLIFISAFFVSAQDADVVTEVLNTKEVTYGQAAYFCAINMDIAQSDDSYEIVLNKLKTQGIIEEDYDCTKPVTLDVLSYIVSVAWNIKSSLLYRVFPCPRYAYTMLCAEGVISKNTDPKQSIDGHTFFNIVTQCIDMYGEKE